MNPPDAPHDDEEGPTLEPSDEMAEALREATEAVEARRRSASEPASGSADKMTIELLSGELRAIKEEFEARARELADEKERFVRLQAEFDNFRRRTLKEKQESLQYGQQNLVKDLLAPVDNLERALGHVEQNTDADLQSVLQGVELVRREFLAALGKHGVKSVDPAGQAFDPAYHEAMGQVPNSDLAPNSVVQVLQKGYMLQDRMLRPARVMVARTPRPGEGEKDRS